MRKYLICILLVFTLFLGSCKKEEEQFVAKEIIADHVTLVDNDEISPYVIIQSVLDENDNLIYSLYYISIFPKQFNDQETNVTLTERFYDYYQVDYITESGKYDNYYHQYNYIDKSERSYGQNFLPQYDFKEELKTVNVLVKYRFTKNNEELVKEIKFKEEIIKFNIDNYNNINNNKYYVNLVKTKNDNEDFNRYKLEINFDNLITKGHFDIQTWVEIDDKIYPFVGYYHYRPNHGNIYSTTDIKMTAQKEINKMYCNICYYDENGVKSNYYFIKDFK